ncbi:glycosyltransferase family 4 protein [Patescibacteria group bacterium]|nr:glycosyltransferase family 4 protein [Patescibacteria group bacterium]
MKIAFLNLYSGINNRGAESFTEELARRLDGKYEVRFFSGRDTTVKITQPEHQQPNNFFLMLRKRLFLDPAAISVLQFTKQILPQLQKEKYDWIIPLNGFWQVILCKFFLRSKILITGHSGPYWDERWNLWLKPDVFVATTEPTAQWAKKVSPWTRVETIPYGIDCETFRKAKPVKLDLERPIILCPAAAVPYKRVDLAIKAVAKMERGSLLHLGQGELLDEIKETGEKLLGKKRFLSLVVDYKDIPGYYAAADIITLPSSPQENSPMVFLESLAAGKVCVATDAPRPRWILGDAGIFVDPTDSDQYAKALEFAAGKTVAMREAERFSWPKIISEYERLFSSPR